MQQLQEKNATEDTDPTHIIRFLGMMTNSEIARKITQKGIPEGMTFGQAFTRAIELEAGYQLSEGVSLARPTEVMHIQEVEEVDEIGTGQRNSRDVECWQCGERGLLQCDCSHKGADDQVESIDDPNAYAGRSEQIIRINQPITVTTRDNIYVTSDQTFTSNKTFILWMLINSDKRLAVGGSWNPGTSVLNREGAVSTWH